MASSEETGVFLPNCIEAVVSIFAILKARGAFVVINHSTGFDKLAYILENCQATGLITSSQDAAQGKVFRLRERSPHLKLTVVTGTQAEDRSSDEQDLGYNAIQEHFPASRPMVRNTELDLACLVYTSGSTGQPKGVMCDHGNVTFVANSVMTYLENTDSDIVTSTTT